MSREVTLPFLPPFAIKLTGFLASMRQYGSGFPARLLAGGQMTKRFNLQKPKTLNLTSNWFRTIDSTDAGSTKCWGFVLKFSTHEVTGGKVNPSLVEVYCLH